MSNEFYITDHVLTNTYYGNETSVVIPDGVTEIKGWVFRYNKTIESITFPNTLTSIETHSFDRCTHLKQVFIPDSVTHIAKGAFAHCTDLSFLSVSSTTSISDTAFTDCPKLADSDGFVKVNGTLFGYYGSKQEVIIPRDVIRIGSFAFSKCSQLTSVTIPDTVTSIGRSAFDGCTNLLSISIPDSVTKIEVGAFKDCIHLQSLLIPDSVTELSQDAFTGCKQFADENGFLIIRNQLFEYFGNVKELVIPDTVKEISHYIFANTSIESVQLPEGITKVNYGLFKNCKQLKKVILPSTITEILYASFMGCENLVEINIPENVKKIEEAAFSQCISLTEIRIPLDADIETDAFMECKGLADKDDFIILNGVLYDHISEDDTTTLVIPNSELKYYDEYTLMVPDYGFYLYNKAPTLIIPNTVVSISNDVFQGCQFENVIIPHSVESISESAFNPKFITRIICNKDSYAYKYAVDHHIQVIAL